MKLSLKWLQEYFEEKLDVDQLSQDLTMLGIEVEGVTTLSPSLEGVVVAQGKVSAGQWVAVHGCGGVGLSAIMIASALGANVVAIDIADDKLELARSVGAIATINAIPLPRLDSS